MIRISMGVISNLAIMLSKAKEFRVQSLSELKTSSFVSGIAIDDAIEFAVACRFISVDQDDLVAILPEGEALLSGFHSGLLSVGAIRTALAQYATNAKPLWVYKTPYGRFEAKALMTVDEQDCLELGSLFTDPPDTDVIQWWDDIASIFRSRQEQRLLQVGRRGEKLTIDYEYCRTGVKPIWESINSNCSGYDIRSQFDTLDERVLYIEVKASELDYKNASMHLTINEWRLANSHPNATRFYLWLLNEKAALAVLMPRDIECHIPTNEGSGVWQEVSIPFHALCDKEGFIEQDYL